MAASSLLLCAAFMSAAVSASSSVKSAASCTSDDWLVCPSTTPVTVTPWISGSISGIVMSNGLVSRSWVTNASGVPSFGLWDFNTMLDGPPAVSLLRTLTPEAAIGVNGSQVEVGGVAVAGRSGPLNFTLIANNSATECTFVAQGPIDSLDSCLAACWDSPTCNIVNWIPDPVNGNDCVHKACTDPFKNPSLSPYTGCYVYATDTPTTGLGPVSSGPFLNRTGLDGPEVLIPTPGALVFQGYTTGAPQARFNWTAGRRGAPSDVAWPPLGLSLSASFAPAPGTQWDGSGLVVEVHYEMYVGSPSISKWVTVHADSSGSGPALVLDSVQVESLGLNAPLAPLAPLAYPQYDQASQPLYPSSGKLGILTDYYYATWVNWTDADPGSANPGSAQPLLTVAELPGLAYPLLPGGRPWTSARVYELLFDDGPEQGVAMPRYPSSETYYGCTLGPCTSGTGSALMGGMTERRGLTYRRFLSLIAPQGMENPLQNHLTASDSTSIRSSCDEMAAVGFEMLVLSYGSGFNVETSEPSYRARIAADIAYCRAKGIEVGGYDLIGWTRDVSSLGWAALTPDGMDSGDACFASGWEGFLGSSFLSFANATGLSMLETDGPYAGYSCSNASHAGHSGQANSVAMQSRAMGGIYSALQSAGVYVNAPDSYFALGISKMGIGYNEGTFRLPDVDLISLIQRQVIFDATYYTLPSMAWSQLPMATYDYNSAFDLGRFQAGVAGQLALGIGTFIYQPQGGPFLPVPQVGDILTTWAGWFKGLRPLLGAGDVIHIARPDGQGLDIVLHARAIYDPPGLLIITNPTAGPITVPVLTVPLYYTGIQPGSTAGVSWEGAASTPMQLDWRGRATLTNVTVPARGMLWATVSQGAN